MNLSPINVGIIGVFALLGIGFYGLLVSRNLIKIVSMLQILAKAAMLGLLVAGNASDQIDRSAETSNIVWPVLASQTLTDPSRPPDAIPFPSGL